MASPGSSIRSAARATYSAYRRVPVRWRLAGGSAALTFVILAGFAAIVGVLTNRQVRTQFNDSQASAISRLRDGLAPGLNFHGLYLDSLKTPLSLADFASGDRAQIRIFDNSDQTCSPPRTSTRPRAEDHGGARAVPHPARPDVGYFVQSGYRVAVRQLSVKPAARSRCSTRCPCPTWTTRSPASRPSCSSGSSEAPSWPCWQACSSPNARCGRSSSSPMPRERSSAPGSQSRDAQSRVR